MSEIYDLKQGDLPLVVSLPHSGESLGPFADKMAPAAKRLVDTDWHLPKLYDFLDDMDVTVLAAKHSRYVVDLNRDPLGKSLYPGQNVTELCPTTTFAEEDLYKPGQAPDVAEVKARLEKYWQPYHSALRAEVERIKGLHGFVFLWDGHSIASEVPRFFDGRLPDFNLGSNDGNSCDADIAQRVLNAVSEPHYTKVLDGRFKGGYITRTYGDPANDIHALQLELSQITYMSESHPFGYIPEKARHAARTISLMIDALLACGGNLASESSAHN